MNSPVTRSESRIEMRAGEGGHGARGLFFDAPLRSIFLVEYQPLARPAAFMATPMAWLPASMNLAKPAPSAHFTPNPRLAMNSRNSAASLTFFSAAVMALAMSAGSPLGAAKPRQAPVE